MYLAKLIFFKILGWKIHGEFPDIPKCIIVVVPHSSWHDFYVGVFVRKILGLEMNFIAKKELFTPPFGWYFKWMGGAPIDRKSNENKVNLIAKIFKARKVFRLAIAPEGTRKNVDTWKSGFYYIALKAEVPIVPVGFDHHHKTVTLFELFYPSGNYLEDYAQLKGLFKAIQPKNL